MMNLLGAMFGGSDKAAVDSWNVSWRVIKLGGPLPSAVGLIAGDDEDDVDETAEAFGVVVSSDAMLQQTHTMLYCPLISGVRDDNKVLQQKPWHVVVDIDPVKNSGLVKFTPRYLVTKVLLPISPNEVNPDGLDYGRLTRDSQKAVARKLRMWFPDFKALV